MANEKRLIDAVAYCKVLREEMDYLLELDKTKGYHTLKERMGLEVAIAELGDMPTVDAVEVVRCKDCEHYKPLKPYPSYNGHTNYCCRSASVRVGDNDFCSYGERKDNEI